MLTILCVHTNEKEQHVANTIQTAVQKYNLPLFTNITQVESMAIPHSHPILTLNTRLRDNEPHNIETFIHEQFHWFAQDNPLYDNCITYLKENYPDLGDCNKSGSYPNSFWEHLIVCRNTRNIVQQIFDQKTLDEDVYGGRQAYPLTEPFVKENFEKLRNDLQKFNMTFDYKNSL